MSVQPEACRGREVGVILKNTVAKRITVQQQIPPERHSQQIFIRVCVCVCDAAYVCV